MYSEKAILRTTSLNYEGVSKFDSLNLEGNILISVHL